MRGLSSSNPNRGYKSRTVAFTKVGKLAADQGVRETALFETDQKPTSSDTKQVRCGENVAHVGGCQYCRKIPIFINCGPKWILSVNADFVNYREYAVFGFQLLL
jgi:hypothetical protein